MSESEQHDEDKHDEDAEEREAREKEEAGEQGQEEQEQLAKEFVVRPYPYSSGDADLSLTARPINNTVPKSARSAHSSISRSTTQVLSAQVKACVGNHDASMGGMVEDMRQVLSRMASQMRSVHAALRSLEREMEGERNMQGAFTLLTGDHIEIQPLPRASCSAHHRPPSEMDERLNEIQHVPISSGSA